MKKIILIMFIVLFGNLFSKSIEVWYYWGDDLEKVFISLGKKYEKETGNTIILKRTGFWLTNSRFKTLAMKGGGPDLVMGPADWVGQFLSDDLIIPLNHFIDVKSLKNEFIDLTIDTCMYRDKLYGLPINFTIAAFVYNTDLIKKPPLTTVELLQVGKKFTNESNGNFGLVYDAENYYYHWPWVEGFGISPLDKEKKPTFSSEQQIKALKFVKSLQIGEDKIMPQDSNEDMASSLFSSGKAAMAILNVWELKKNADKNINFDIMPFPIVNETGLYAKPLVGAELVMVSSKSKNKLEAIDFLKYITSEEAQIEFSKTNEILPTRKEIYNYKFFKESPYFKYFQKLRNQAQNAVPMPRDPELSKAVWPFGGVMLRQVFQEQDTLENIVEEAQKKGLEALK